MVSEVRNIDARSERNPITPRQSARIYLPELAADWQTWQASFAARLEHLLTPDGSWGSDPTAGWPRLAASPLPAPWPPVTPKTPRGLKP